MPVFAIFPVLFLLSGPLLGSADGVSGPGTVPPAVPGALTSLDDGIAEARKRGGSRIFVFFQGRECGDCDRMNALIVPAKAFQQYVEDKIVVSLDIGSDQ
ncbi:MAG TPA: thioredoxin family protein, partial [Thermoanaerobaculia bacterium]